MARHLSFVALTALTCLHPPSALKISNNRHPRQDLDLGVSLHVLSGMRILFALTTAASTNEGIV